MNDKDQMDSQGLEGRGTGRAPARWPNKAGTLRLSRDPTPTPTTWPGAGSPGNADAPLWPPPGSEDYRSRFSSECFMDLVCPEKCRCEGTIVDCSNQKLARIPSHLPEYVTDL